MMILFFKSLPHTQFPYLKHWARVWVSCWTWWWVSWPRPDSPRGQGPRGRGRQGLCPQREVEPKCCHWRQSGLVVVGRIGFYLGRNSCDGNFVWFAFWWICHFWKWEKYISEKNKMTWILMMMEKSFFFSPRCQNKVSKENFSHCQKLWISRKEKSNFCYEIGQEKKLTYS